MKLIYTGTDRHIFTLIIDSISLRYRRILGKKEHNYGFYYSTILALLLTFCSLSISAATYYIAPNGSDNNNGSITAPFATLNKAWTVVAAGDLVYMRGGIYLFTTQQLLRYKNGTASNLIKVWAYPSETPVITFNGSTPGISLTGNYIDFKGIEINGMTILSGWTNTGNGIYSKAVTCQSATNMVTVNGVNTPMGRYPNLDAGSQGYLTIDSHSSSSTITDAALPSTPNFTGGEVVVRRRTWVLDRCIITNHTAQTISYTPYSGGSTSEPSNGSGYFIQNNINTLDQFGEWYYNGTTLYMYFGTNDPSSYVVKTSVVDDLIYVLSSNNVSFNDMSFQGSNLSSFKANSSNSISLNNCKINYSGKAGIDGVGAGLQVSNSKVNNSNNCAISLQSKHTGTLMINNNTISNSGLFAGMGSKTSLDGSMQGIWSFGVDYLTIQYNKVINTGYNAINFDGIGTIIKNNFIDTFCSIKDDGAGVYTWNDEAQTLYTNPRQIKNNIIKNGIGAFQGGTACGIYMDDGTDNVEISGNTIANCNSHGIYIHHSTKINTHNNTLYNNAVTSLAYPIEIVSPVVAEPIRNAVINSNIVFSTINQRAVEFMSSVNIPTEIVLFGTMDSNYYCFPINNNPTFFITNWNNIFLTKDFAGWKAYSGKDLNAHLSPITVPSVSYTRFEYNDSTVNKTVSLGGTYLDAKGSQYSGSITLSPYTSAVLMLTTSTNQVPSIQNQGFQMNENSPNGTTVGTVVASDPNVGQTLTYSILSGNTNGAFAINAATGILTVANTSALNYEVINSFALIVKVQDNGAGNLSSQATVTITLLNVNEQPVISNQTFSVSGNPLNGTVVGTVVASDPDAGQSLTYSILSGNTNGAFAINASTGVITVANSAAVGAGGSGGTNYSVFPTPTPSISQNYIGSGASPLELGMKFFSSSDGYITSLRFYKGVGAQGTHIGNLWSINGVNLASGTYTGETASGWQTLTLSSPVAITANTLYVVSYFSQHGDYVKNDPYFTTNILNGPLTGIAWTASEPNGVYKYTATSAFPNNNAYVGSTNYWADVVFTSSVSSPSSFALLVKVQDNGSGNLSNQATMSINTISGSNNPPSINNQAFTVSENVSNGTVVGSVVASDPDAGQTLTYSIQSGNTNGAFTINATTGAITVANSAALNYEVVTSFALVVKVQDNGTGILSSQATVTISLLNVNELPVISNQTFSINENSANGTAVGSIVASDPDAGQTLTYSILSGNTNGAFIINASTGAITVANSAALNYEVVTSFALVVKVQDNGTGNLSSQATVTVSLLNVNELPVISNQVFSLNENSANGTTVGSVVASDPDAGQTISYSILSGNTNSAFAINASTGVITVANSAALNYEVISSFALIVKVQDNGTGNLSSQATITISILNVNEPPVVNNQTFSVVQMAANGTQVGTVVATDPDVGQTRTFAITSGNTSSAFSINSSSGILTVSNSSALVFQTNPVFNLNVRVTDNGTGNLYDDATITINVQNTNQPPVILNQSFSLNENAINGTVVGNIVASDPDAGQTLTYSILSGNTNSAFTINATSGALSVSNSAALNYEVLTSFALIIKVQDNGIGALSNQASVTINLLNVNELPVITNQSFYLSENSANGTSVGIIVASDPDAGQILTYSIQSGNTNNAFAINATTGALSVSNSASLNYEAITSYALVVKAQDNGTGNLNSQAIITITLLNVNEPPLISNQSFSVSGSASNGTVVGSVVASDPDAGQTLTYSILSGNTNGAFAINPSTGVITVANSTALGNNSGSNYSLFQATPSITQNYVGNGNAPLEVGMKFFSNVNGFISGLRFYKGAGGQGLHIGNLWTINGINLASATFTGESSSGWQTVTLSSPVAITANTIYVVSYFSQHGDYVKNDPYFSANIVNGPLTGLGWSATEPNGVYKYTATSAFPNNSAYIGSANYWADVIFSSAPSPTSFALIVNVQDNGIGNLSNQAAVTINVQQALKSSLSDDKTNSVLKKTRLYPNPVTNGILNVEPGNGINEQFDLVIFDMSGKALMKRHYDHTENISLDLSAYSEGVYALQIRSYNFIFTDKFILK